MTTAVVNECIPYQEPGDDLPCSVKAGKTVLGKRFVVIAEDMQGAPDGLTEDVEGNNYVIEQAAANAAVVLGVASHNAAEKTKVTVKGAPCVLPVVAGAAIKAGERVGVGAEGKAVKAVASSEAEIKEGKGDWKVPPVGLALADAAEGADCPVKLF